VTPESYLLFVGACLVLSISPGPDMALILSRCIGQGRKAGAVAALGVSLGAHLHLLAAVTGLSAILATSATAFTVVKWIGAAYLVFLGVQAIVSRSGPLALRAQQERGLWGVFWQGSLTDALNPKVALFFLALLPQFVDPEAGRVLGQLLFLGFTCNLIGILFNLALVYVSGAVTGRLRRSAKATAIIQKAMGVVFIGLGARLAASKA
jgi:threonine/homoserine/homoserine lactone efflux protein